MTENTAIPVGYCKSMFGEKFIASNLTMHENHLESLSKHSLLDPTLRGSDSKVLGWGLRITVWSKFLGTVEAADPGTTL